MMSKFCPTVPQPAYLLQGRLAGRTADQPAVGLRPHTAIDEQPLYPGSQPGLNQRGDQAEVHVSRHAQEHGPRRRGRPRRFENRPQVRGPLL